MVRKRSENRDKAFNIYKEHNGNIKVKEIAEMLEETSGKISTWKSNDKWDEQLNIRKRGGQKGNKNAVGNKGGKGAPKGNLNAMTHGNRIPPERFNSKSFLAKYLPKVTQNIMEEISVNGLTTLDILWSNIEIHYTAIIRSQKIMHVKNQKDITKVKSKEQYGENSSTEEWEYQFAWDKQEKFITAQSKAMKALSDMIKQYEDLLHKNWDLATEEQRLRIEVLKSKIVNNEKSKEDKIDEYFAKLENTIKE